MSAISEKVRQALYAKLNVSGVTTLATGGVHHRKAPESVSTPYVIFQRQAPRPVSHTFGLTVSHEDDLWLIKALTDEDSSTSKEPEELAEDILEACETAIGSSLTITGGEVWLVTRTVDMPDYTEQLTDRTIHHHGFFLRIVTGT